MLKNLLNNVREKIAEIIAPKRELTKQEIFTRALNQYPIVSILIQTNITGLVLPEHLMKQEFVTLQYGLNLANPIKDLAAGQDGIKATLSFHRKYFETFVPWDAVMMIAEGNPPPIGPSGGSPNLIVLKGGGETNDARGDLRVAA